MQRNLPLVVVGAGLCALAAGCLTLADDDGPTLAIDLYWDDRPGDPEFDGVTCDEADVEWMEWTLYRIEDGKRVEVDSRSERCADLLEVIEPRPGDYELDITGIDDRDQALWSVTCGEPGAYLTIVRFDVAYICDIHAD
jgi:predicted  nucleic acid-binding Zn-ribbon protein